MKLNISGRRARSEPRHATPKTAVVTDPWTSSSLVLWLTAPTAIPARTRAPIASSRRLRMALMVTPRAGSTPLSSSAVSTVIPAERSRL